MRRPSMTLLVSFVALFAVPPSFAVDCQIPTETADKALAAILVARPLGCFGGSEDKNQLTVRVAKAIQAAKCTTTIRPELESLRETLSDLVGDINTDLFARASTTDADWTEEFATLSIELLSAERTLRATEGIAAPTYWQWGASGHRTFQQADSSFLLDYEPLIRAGCSSSKEDCALSVANAASINRAVELGALVNRCAVQARLEGTRKALSNLDAAWDQYFFKTRSQYFWELALNSSLFKDTPDRFAAPPNGQFILVHPEVAMEYVGGGAREERAYDAIVMAELVGYNRISWGPRNDGSPSRLPPLGVALVGTYTPDNSGDQIGYGLMFHIHHTLSLGVTWRDTGAGRATTYLLSTDLMRLVLNPSFAAMAKFRGDSAPAAP